MVESTAKLREEILALTDVDIMEADGDTFKSTYKIMEELAEKWQDLSDIQQATVTELIAGKRQGNIVSSLMSNFEIAEQALETSLNSSGSAMQEHEKWQQSLEARINKLKATWQSLSQSFLSSDFLKTTLDGVIALVNGLDKLISTFGTLPSLFTLFAGGRYLFSGKGFFRFNKETQSIQLLGNSFSALGDKYSLVSTKIAKYNSLNASSQAKLRTQWANSTTSFGRYISGLNGGKATMGGYITSLVGAKVATFALQAASMALNMALTMGISAAITWLISKFDDWIETSEELKERIEEVTSKYKEQHSTLMKLQGDYDTSNEDSMISRYGELSKGVDALGKNVSLTADEYSEYQGIVDTIASQMPSLVTGYNSQGDAILSCAGNVDTLAEAYRNLIKEQNSEVLKNGSDIFKDFKNDLKDTTAYYKEEIQEFENGVLQGSYSIEHFDTDHFDELGKLMNLSGRQRERYLNNLSHEEQVRISELLEEQGIKRDVLGSGEKGYETYSEHIIRALNEDKAEIKNVLDDAAADLNAYAEDMGTVTEAYFSTAFLGGDGSSIGDYSHLSERMQGLINQITSNLGSDFYDDFLSKEDPFGALTQYYNELLGKFDELNDVDSTTLEAAFDLQTKFNGGEIPYGQYVKGIQDAQNVVSKMGLSDEITSQIKLSLNTEEVTDNYEALKERLTSDEFGIQMGTKEAEDFLSGLTASEYSVFVDLVAKGEVDLSNFDIESFRQYLKEEAELLDALNFTIAIDVEVESLEAFNTAMAESVSGAGLSSESITALKGRYADLEKKGYDLSDMFEETSNGIHLNSEAVDELERAYTSDKLSKTKDNLDVLKGRYDELTDEINNCTDASERANLYREQQSIIQKINDLGALASQYEGLTSAYNAWQNAESSGSERDMYEGIIDGWETVEDELSRGWLDDGTIKFIELLTGRTDLAGKSAKELKDIWNTLDDTIENTSYSINDFFTVDEDGNSTSKGVYNFLDAIHQLEKTDKFKGIEGIEKLVEKDSNGNIIGFDFGLVAEKDENGNIIKNGDEVIAEALGISEELVQIMLRAADDAGFVVTLDGNWTQFADLKNQAEEANDTIKKLAQTNKELNEAGFGEYEFDFDANTVEGITEELDKAKELLDNDAFKDKDGNFNINAEGASEALKIAETLQIAKSQLEEPTYMSIDTSELQEELQKPVELLQEYEKLTQERDLLNLTGTDKERLSEIDSELQTIADNLAGLDEGTKVNLGIDGMTPKQIREELENGTIEVPTELTIEANMDKSLEDLVTLGLLEQGLISEEEAKVRLNIDVEANEVDTSEVENKVDNALNGKTGDGLHSLGGEVLTRETNIEIIAETTGVEDVDGLSSKLKNLDDKTIQAIAEVVGQVDVDKLRDTIARLEPKQVEAIAEAIGKGDVEGLKTAINSLDPTYVQAIAEAFGYNDVNELNGAIDNLDSKTVQAIAEALGINDVNSLKGAIDKLDNKNVKATATTFGKDGVDDLRSSIDKVKSKTVTIKSVFESIFSGGSVRQVADGTAHIDGTAFADGTAFSKSGKAFKQGDWGTKKTETALTGELGQELVVYKNRYWTVGDNGAEFATIPKGAIVFNHKQTEELFANGKVTSGGGRGRAFASGTAFSSGYGGGLYPEIQSSSIGFGKSSSSSSKPSSSSSSSSSKSKSSSSSSSDDFEETLDWIETKIDRIERAIDQLDQTANSTYKSWSDRNNALVNEISKVGDEIDIQRAAYDRYMQEADAVGLPEYLAEKVRNGTIDIETITDEGLVDKIKEYEKWYNNALDTKKVIEELKEEEAELYAQRFENVQSQYDGILQGFEHTESMLDEYISQAEEKGYIVSKEYYKALIDNESAIIAQLEDEQSDLLAKRQDYYDAMITQGMTDEEIRNSEGWLDMSADIDSVTQAIEESTTSMIELNNSVREIDWEIFDLIQDRISGITEEADFLIDLLSGEKLYDDDGNLTDKGFATMGLHGQNYNTYMHQADMYGDEIAELDKQIVEDPYNQDLINRRQEVVGLQQESILAANDEKEAIRDMVEEGIQYELDALQERIDKYNEALDSQKDLYEYNKKVKKQTEEIASLEKQRLSYLGDDSEEGQAKLQEIEVSLKEAKEDLQETEYDKLIDDSAALLDELYLEYETILNQRLDNIDVLLEQTISEINSGASIIGDTIRETADSVGYTLSDSMETIWDENSVNTQNVVATYGDKFLNAQTTTNSVLSGISTSVNSMVASLNKDATKQTTANKTSTSAKKDPTKTSTSTTTKKTNTQKKSGGDGTPKIGDRVKYVSGQYYYDSQGKKPLGSHNQGKYVYITNINKKDWATHGYHISTGNKLGKGDLGWLKLNQLSGYATGKKDFLEDEVAWTQEGGEQEFIVRPSDGAILTPIAKRDSILSPIASNNIWSMANSPADFIRENLNFGAADIPNSSNIQHNYTQHLDKVVFNMPNVKNYEEFLAAMQRDKNFERLIDSMTIGRIAGKSGLAKGKSIR